MPSTFAIALGYLAACRYHLGSPGGFLIMPFHSLFHVSTDSLPPRPATDALSFADALALADTPWPELMAVIAAATGFKRDLLPADVQALYDACTVYVEREPVEAPAETLRPILRLCS